MSENSDFPTPPGIRDQGRDRMADVIDEYMSEGGEFRSYDLADRLLRKLNGSGWWFVWGSDVERMISEEHPFNASMAADRQRYADALRSIVDHYGWGGGGHRGAYITAKRALDDRSI